MTALRSFSGMCIRRWNRRDGRLVHASRDGTAAFRIAWTTDGRGNRRTRDVWTGVQAYRLDFASAGPRP